MNRSKRLAYLFPSLHRHLLRVVGPLRHFAWRLKSKPPIPRDEITQDMLPTALEGYTSQLFYLPGQTVAFHLKAKLSNNHLLLEHYKTDEVWETITEHTFDELLQTDTLDEAQNGCHWPAEWEFSLPATAAPGYYRATLTNPELEHPTYLHFLVGSVAPASNVAVLAPVTTWLAYNGYGGQSLYRNALDEGYVPFVSSQRPNTALTYHCTHPLQHNLRIEAHIFQWFAAHYAADLYPDYFLEAHPKQLARHKVVVLAYHAEYFSEKMYRTLWDLVFQKGISLLALGGNQIYWQVRWHQNFTQLECRKNGSFFQNEATRGTLWRHTARPEALLLGAQFSEAGMSTYAPYQVLEPGHWLFADTGVKEGETFGATGLDGLPICGDETDKATWSTPANTMVLARGLNKADGEVGEIYTAKDPAWNSKGGGEITLTEITKTCAILNTGSIQSGAGLGVDEVFTKVIRNFMQRYL
jgi:N,N-dimethylformamidase